MTEEQRAVAIMALSETIIEAVVDKFLALEPAERTSLAVAACVSAAMAFAAASTAMDAKAAVGLIHCVAESCAADIFGTDP